VCAMGQPRYGVSFSRHSTKGHNIRLSLKIGPQALVPAHKVSVHFEILLCVMDSLPPNYGLPNCLCVNSVTDNYSYQTLEGFQHVQRHRHLFACL